jgi:hypothetical protein
MVEMWYFYGSLLWVGLLQVFWIGAFVGFAVKSTADFMNPKGSENWHRVRRAIRAWQMPTVTVAHRFGLQATEVQQRGTDTFKQQKADAVTIGGLGLAAWSVLEALKPGMAAGATRLLFLSVLINLGGATFFRQGPSERSYVGLEAFLIVGFFAVVLALLAFVPAVFETTGWQRDILYAAAALGALLETLRCVGNVNRHRRLFHP